MSTYNIILTMLIMLIKYSIKVDRDMKKKANCGDSPSECVLKRPTFPNYTFFFCHNRLTFLLLFSLREFGQHEIKTSSFYVRIHQTQVAQSMKKRSNIDKRSKSF